MRDQQTSMPRWRAMLGFYFIAVFRDVCPASFPLDKGLPDPCHTEDGQARRCAPDFVNAAFGKEVVASSTCGDPASRYCMSTTDREGKTGRSCFVCDANNSKRRHPASHLTDLNNPNNLTCWLSEPLSNQATPQNVSLTLSLGKKYEITYVSLQFCSSRPDSMVIYKSMDSGRSWTPFQFYSSQCRKVYERQPRALVTRANEQEALCSEAFSSVAQPHAGGARVAFSTLEGRPSSTDFDNSPVLQDWQTATDIRIVFNRLTPLDVPLADEMSRDGAFYSLSDFAVGGRCKCNGHASRCVPDEDGKLACECRHNTDGKDCERCKPFYYDRPWARATSIDGNECLGEFHGIHHFVNCITSQTMPRFSASHEVCASHHCSLVNKFSSMRTITLTITLMRNLFQKIFNKAVFDNYIIAKSYWFRSASVYFLGENLKTCDIRKQSLASSLNKFLQYLPWNLLPRLFLFHMTPALLLHSYQFVFLVRHHPSLARTISIHPVH